MSEPDFKIGGHDVLELVHWSPKDWEDLEVKFEEWLTKGGEDSRQSYFVRCSKYCQHSLPKDLARLDTVMAIQAGIGPWVGEQLTDLENFVTFARGLAIGECRDESVFWESMTSMEKAMKIDMKISVFVRWRDLFKRLYETIGKRVSAGQTMSANQRTDHNPGQRSAGHRP